MSFATARENVEYFQPRANQPRRRDIARERGLALDLDGFEQAMAQQRERARLVFRAEAKLTWFAPPPGTPLRAAVAK